MEFHKSAGLLDALQEDYTDTSPLIVRRCGAARLRDSNGHSCGPSARFASMMKHHHMHATLTAHNSPTARAAFFTQQMPWTEGVTNVRHCVVQPQTWRRRQRKLRNWTCVLTRLALTEEDNLQKAGYHDSSTLEAPCNWIPWGPDGVAVRPQPQRRAPWAAGGAGGHHADVHARLGVSSTAASLTG